MVKTILYFHGFASSSDSDKAKIIKSYISKISKKIKIFTPDLSNNFKEANNQITKLIDENEKDLVFMGSSLGCLLYTSPSPRDRSLSRMPSSA